VILAIAIINYFFSKDSVNLDSFLYFLHLIIMATPSILPSNLSVDAVIGDPRIPKVYANGFLFGHSLSDASVIFQIGNNPQVVVNMSFTTLKTLSKGLNEIVAQVEKGLGSPIPDIKEVLMEWQKNTQPKKEEETK
jgi:hypothetical protein